MLSHPERTVLARASRRAKSEMPAAIESPVVSRSPSSLALSSRSSSCSSSEPQRDEPLPNAPPLPDAAAATPVDETLRRQVQNQLSNVPSRSTSSGVFAREMVYDVRAAISQARAGVHFTHRVASFLRESCELENKFADRLSALVDREMMSFHNDQDSDAMKGIRDLWMSAVEESRVRATAARASVANLMRLVGPLAKAHAVSAKKLDLIVAENDRLGRPLLQQQTAVVKKQVRCSRLVAPMLGPEFAKLPRKHQDKVKARARPEVERYLQEVDRANAWLEQVTTNARPRMLNMIQHLEQDRIQRIEHSLKRYGESMRMTSACLDQSCRRIEERQGKYHSGRDIASFVDMIRMKSSSDREYLEPFAYRLPITLSELGLQKRAVLAAADHAKIPHNARSQHDAKQQHDARSQHDTKQQHDARSHRDARALHHAKAPQDARSLLSEVDREVDERYELEHTRDDLAASSARAKWPRSKPYSDAAAAS